MEKGLCLDTMGKTAGNKFQAIPCHHQGGNQVQRNCKKKTDEFSNWVKVGEEGGCLIESNLHVDVFVIDIYTVESSCTVNQL